MLTLSQIREKNKTSTSLLQVNAMNQEYSNELINQCREEFETFVKPIRNKVVGMG
ncbi:spermidine acetyltransferase [Clostridium botulinum]|nr:spermidine acetyltransferase [Clostridium botulinum]